MGEWKSDRKKGIFNLPPPLVFKAWGRWKKNLWLLQQGKAWSWSTWPRLNTMTILVTTLWRTSCWTWPSLWTQPVSCSFFYAWHRARSLGNGNGRRQHESLPALHDCLLEASAAVPLLMPRESWDSSKQQGLLDHPGVPPLCGPQTWAINPLTKAWGA